MKQNKHQAADQKPWKPGAWVYYPNEETGGVRKGDLRHSAGTKANQFIARLIALPKE